MPTRRIERLLFALLLPVTLCGAQGFPPAVAPPAPAMLPAPVVRLLPNGVTVAVVERHAVPLVTVDVAIETGAEADPAGGAGTANLVAALLPDGTETRSALEIAQAVDQVGGTLETEAGWDESDARLTVLSSHAPFAFDLLADMIRRAVFAPTEFDRTRKQLFSALDVARSDPAYLADNALRAELYAGTSYGHPLDGTRESVERITPASLKEFHAKYYRSSNTAILVVGNMTPDDALSLANQYFGDWPAEPPPPLPPSAAPSLAPAREITVVDDPNAVQTEIRVGFPAAARSSPEFIALSLANQVLGGPADNRLFNSLRSQRGLTYGASSALDGYRSLGGWVASTSTRTAETVRALRVMVDQIGGLRTGTVLPAEVATAQSYLIGHQAVQLESFDRTAQQLLEIMLYGLPRDEWALLPRQLRDLNVGDVNRIARQYLDPSRERVVLVGNAQEFLDNLKKVGPVRVIPLSRLDLGSSNLERGSGRGGDERR